MSGLPASVTTAKQHASFALRAVFGVMLEFLTFAAAPRTLTLPRRLPVRRGSSLLCRRVSNAAAAPDRDRAAARTQPGSVPSRLRSTTHMLRFRRSRLAAHLTELQLRGLPCPAPDAPSRMDSALASAGNTHEQRVLARLMRECAAGAPPVTIPRSHPRRHELTAAALRDGAPVVHQPALTDGKLLDGYGDILLRNSHNPFLPAGGVYPKDGYCVIEVKLASTVKADYALQAGAYSEMLRILSEEVGVSAPGPPFLWLGAAADAPVPLPAEDAAFFFRSVRRAFFDFIRDFDPSASWPPIDAPLRDLAPWTDAVRARMQREDSILQVAGVRRSQVRALERVGVSTMLQLADMSVTEVVDAVDSIGRAPLEALQRQAVLQVLSREQGPGTKLPVYEVRDVAPSAPHGLHRLPPRCPDDLFFDMEGFPLVEGGLEYLFGAWSEDVGGRFHAWWAHTRVEEERQFAAFIQWLWSRWQKAGGHGQSGMHVFHYGHYEVTALRRMACRALTADGLEAGQRLEDLLDASVFVDLYKIVKTSLGIGEPSYSIKNVEKLVGVSRAGDELADAESSVAMYYEWRRTALDSEKKGDPDDERGRALLRDIELYNRQDCESLDRLVQWLRGVAGTHDITYSPWVPPVARADEKTGVEDCEGGDGPLARGACGANALRKSMDSAVIKQCDMLSVELLRNGTSRVRGLFAHLLGFHVRETGPARGRFGDRVSRASSRDLSSLFHDDECLSRVWKSAAPGQDDSAVLEGRGRATSYFDCDPLEPHRLQAGDSCALVHTSSVRRATEVENEGSAEDPFEPVAGFVRVRDVAPGSVGVDLGSKLSLSDMAPTHGALISSDELIICPSAMRASILESASEFHAPVDDDVSKSLPVVVNYLGQTGFRDGDSADHGYAAREDLGEIVANLNGRSFIIQGPPGTGKTVTSARLIEELIFKHGMTVAVSSNSHAAIDNLLERAVQNGIPPLNVLKVGAKSAELELLGVRRASNVGGTKIRPLDVKSERTTKSVCLVGGTAYALSSADALAAFDVLFVDEAGQVPMANFVAMARCATSAVLVGDQQQLDMPLQAKHPDLVGKSCLSYFIGDGIAIVPPSKGVFLETSYRMAPALCEFVSRSMYNNALLPAESAATHAVHTAPAAASPASSAALLSRNSDLSGLVFVNRELHALDEHKLVSVLRGRRHCPTEVQIASAITAQLLCADYTAKRVLSPLRSDDIMVVAPYNVQVAALRDALPAGVRVGTIDKFQGQEAPVVIVSTCAMPEGGLDADGYDSGEGVGLEDSDGNNDDRGTWFALQRKRLNVALSRAQCLAIVIGPEELASRADAKTLEDAGVLAFYSKIVEVGS